jgi:hypothetical protein
MLPVGFKHTQRHITVGTTPLPNTQQSQPTNFHAPGGIQTPNPSRRAAADTRLRPRGHWDRPKYALEDEK